MKIQSFKILLVAAIVLVAILFISNWKTSTAELGPEKDKAGKETASEAADIISEEDFLKSVFANIKSPAYVIGAVNNTDSAAMQVKAMAWAKEANTPALYYYLKERELNEKSELSEITLFSRDAVFNSVSIPDAGQSNFIAGLAKKWMDKGLKKSPEHIPLLNALIVYQSQFVNQPMQFLATLRKTIALDSMNEETNLIHINLLKTSGQLPKAIEKCKKLVSLQPQNSLWTFQLSETYAMMGDSTNAKTFLDLAIKQSRTKNLKE